MASKQVRLAGAKRVVSYEVEVADATAVTSLAAKGEGYLDASDPNNSIVFVDEVLVRNLSSDDGGSGGTLKIGGADLGDFEILPGQSMTFVVDQLNRLYWSNDSGTAVTAQVFVYMPA